jgi:hypothetical protein
MALPSCADNEDTSGVGTAGEGTTGGMAGKPAGGSPSAGKGGDAKAGSAAGGKAGGGGSAGSISGGGNAPGGAPGVDPSAGAGGDSVAGAAGQPTNGGESGDGGEGGAGGDDTGPHQGPTLEYGFDEGAGTVVSDSSGLGHDGTLSEAAWSTEGRTGGALLLAGGKPPSKYVTLPPGAFANAHGATIAAWVKVAENTMWSRIFDFGGQGAGTDTRFMYLTPNSPAGLRFSYFGGAVEREATVTTGTTLPIGIWKHVAVTLSEAGEQAIYIDGFPAAEASGMVIEPLELEPLAAASWLGKSRFDADAGFAGAMDDFLIFDRVLSASEIATLAYPKSDYSRIPFDEGTGTSSQDLSERAADATLTEGATWTSGRLGAAVQLSGTAQWVTLDNPIAGCTDELTVALWVKHVAAGNWSRIFDFGGTTDNFMYLTPSTHESKLHLAIHIAGEETSFSSASTIPADSEWHHLAVVVAPAAATVFIDGESIGSTPDPVLPSELGATNEHWLGKSRFNDPTFNGAFDEVRISCRAFTADEIRNLAFGN